MEKITYLVLHLGYGGIETSVINQANALAGEYEVEVVSLYHLKKNQASRLDGRVTVTYLYEGEPNKEEFLAALHGHKYLKTLREGIRAVKILHLKKNLVARSIKKCTSDYIISTRYDFSEALSRYGNENAVKIAEEHHHHNGNRKYIRVLSTAYSGIDCLFALNQKLAEDYKGFLKNNPRTKVAVVPNMLPALPEVKSDLESGNMITVSRLDPGKRNNEIVEAFSKLQEKDGKLFIIGDGKEYGNLDRLIKEKKLQDRAILTGYKNKSEIEGYMTDSALFLMASVTEGMPMVLLEAMSYGVPCIAYETDCGVADIISDGVNGFVIRNRDEAEYVKKIELVLSDRTLRKELGRNAVLTARAFSADEVKKILIGALKDAKARK